MYPRFGGACPRAACLLSLLAAVGGLAGSLRGNIDEINRLMITTVDVTKEGKEVAPPTPANPAYYVPVVIGYKERGEIIKHYERQPPEDALLILLATKLADQGYLLASREHPPSLTITLEWGTIAPIYIRRSVLNTGEMRMIILGESQRDVSTLMAGYSDEMRSLGARHYLLISAFRYQRSAKTPDVLLWRAHSTTDAWGEYLEKLVTPMVKAVAPGFGRPLKPGAAWLDERTGNVTIGELKVIEDSGKK